MNQYQAEQMFIDYFSQLGGGFTADSFASLGVSAQLCYYDKGEYLIEQGCAAPKLFFLATGLVRYVSVSPTGKAFTQSFAQAPSLAGSTRAMVGQTPALFSIEVLEPVICLVFDWAEFFSQMKNQPGFLESYCALLEALFIGKEERENSFVQLSAEQRYLQFIDQYPHLLPRIPLQFIASYIGVTPVALSRVRKKLQLSGSD